MNDINYQDPPIVWQLVELPPNVRRDLSSCQGFGELRTILDHKDTPSLKPYDCLEKTIQVLQEAQDGDYFVFPAGDPMAPLIIGMALSYLGISKFFWLRWDRRTNRDGDRVKVDGFYSPIEVDVQSLEKLYNDED